MRIPAALLILATFLVGCKKELKNDFKDLKNVEFAGLVIPLPGIYAETDLDELIEAWQDSEVPPEVVEMKIKHLESLRPREGSFAIFVDTTDISNTVMIFIGPYIKIGKWTSAQLFLTLDKRLRAEAKDLGVEYTPIENSYYSLQNGNDVLKAKFEWKNSSEKWYGTEYLLNVTRSTFGIIVNNNEDDFESLIRRGKFIANNELGELQFQLELHLDATFDKQETEQIKERYDPTVEFVGPNNFKIEKESLDSLNLEKRLAEVFKNRRQSELLVIIDSKDRTHKEYIFIIGQLHRVLLRLKDTLSLERFGVKYEEIKNQKDIDSIDKIIPLETMTVYKTNWQ